MKENNNNLPKKETLNEEDFNISITNEHNEQELTSMGETGKSSGIISAVNFPHFNSPISSRFESLFLLLNKTGGNKKKNVSYKIFPERIIRGEDKRTSILIKNIPKNIKKKEIRGMV